ncbi:MAG TPA: hypothetical protein VML19_20285 [Verrucomicrobiae bacterium]|nr:hypothetical protein [Verrucomicrobiae bacterium]
MATRALVSGDEYLKTMYKPSCDYIDGVPRPKSLGTRKHGKRQIRLGRLIEKRFPDFEPDSELTCQIRTGLADLFARL